MSGPPRPLNTKGLCVSYAADSRHADVGAATIEEGVCPDSSEAGLVTLIRNSRHALGFAEQRVARGCVLGGTARKGPTGGWVERRDDEGATPRQDPLIRTRG
jgi:hypothetical protein